MNLYNFFSLIYIEIIITNILICNLIVCDPVLVITTIYNHPELVELQYKSLKKFLKDDYRFVVFNDANDQSFSNLIENECKRFNIEHYKVPQEIHQSPHPEWVNIDSAIQCAPLNISAAYRHSQALRYAFEKFDYYRNGIITVIDNDCFLINNFSIKEFMEDTAISAIAFDHGKLSYALSPIIAFFNMKKIVYPESMILEAGFLAYTYKDPFFMLEYYLYSHPEVAFKLMRHIRLLDLFSSEVNLTNLNTTCSNEFIDFLKHYRNASINGKIGLNSYSVFVENTFIHLGESRNLSSEALCIKLIKEFILKDDQ